MANCPHCNNEVSEYYKTNRYWYKDHIENPKKFREEYISDTGVEEYLDFLEEWERDKDNLDGIYEWIDQFPYRFTFNCEHCKKELNIHVVDNMIDVSRYSGYSEDEIKEENEIMKDLISPLFNKEIE
jgi:hypothetical protein